jgi:hypothetical protein
MDISRSNALRNHPTYYRHLISFRLTNKVSGHLTMKNLAVRSQAPNVSTTCHSALGVEGFGPADRYVLSLLHNGIARVSGVVR